MREETRKIYSISWEFSISVKSVSKEKEEEGR